MMMEIPLPHTSTTATGQTIPGHYWACARCSTNATTVLHSGSSCPSANICPTCSQAIPPVTPESGSFWNVVLDPRLRKDHA